MATVSFYQYQYATSGFYPGTERRHSFGPSPTSLKAIAVTAHPFDAENQNRTLVTDVSVQTTTQQSHYVNVVVRNVGRDMVGIYYINLAAIGP